jgi:hypothetical protein
MNANLVAQLDCLCSFTQLAIENKYVCPELDETFELEIKNGSILLKAITVACHILPTMFSLIEKHSS